MDESDPVKVKKDFTTKIRENPFILSTIVCGILAILLLIFIVWDDTTNKVISESEAMDIFKKFADTQLVDIEILGAKIDGSLYQIIFKFNKTKEYSIYLTSDGKYLVNELIPVSIMDNQTSPKNNNAQPMLECAEQYGISSDTIIFYYSEKCGWCAKMKPGVEALEEEGYKFHWVEVSDTETLELIDNCIKSYMTNQAVPQFICPKTEEIYTGAFVNENEDLDQLALKAWADNCISTSSS